MSAVLYFDRPLFHQPEVSLMNQGSALEGMVRTFLSQVMFSNSAQLFIHNRDERLEGLVIPGSPFAQEGADRLGRGFCHTHTVLWTKDLKLTSKIVQGASEVNRECH
jgi:hypothetical protein